MKLIKHILLITNIVWIIFMLINISISQMEIAQKFQAGSCPSNHPVGAFDCSNGLMVVGFMFCTMIIWIVSLMVFIIMKIYEKRKRNDI